MLFSMMRNKELYACLYHSPFFYNKYGKIVPGVECLFLMG